MYIAHAHKHGQQVALKGEKLRAEDSSIAQIFLTACDGWALWLGSARPDTISSPTYLLL